MKKMPGQFEEGRRVLQVGDRVRFVGGGGYPDGTVTALGIGTNAGMFGVRWDDEVETMHDRRDLWWMATPEPVPDPEGRRIPLEVTGITSLGDGTFQITGVLPDELSEMLREPVNVSIEPGFRLRFPAANAVRDSQWSAWWEGVTAAVNRWHRGREYVMVNPYPRPEGLDELIPGPLPDREDGYVTRDPRPWERFDGSRAPHTGVNLASAGYNFNPRPEYELK